VESGEVGMKVYVAVGVPLVAMTTLE